MDLVSRLLVLLPLIRTNPPISLDELTSTKIHTIRLFTLIAVAGGGNNAKLLLFFMEQEQFLSEKDGDNLWITEITPRSIFFAF